LIHSEVEENKEDEDDEDSEEEDNSGILGVEGFQNQISNAPLVNVNNPRNAFSTGKKKGSGKGGMLNEVEDWYQYIPTFKKHIKKGKKVPGSVRKPTSNIVKLLKSPFPNRTETIFFNYPKYVGQQKTGFDNS